MMERIVIQLPLRVVVLVAVVKAIAEVFPEARIDTQDSSGHLVILVDPETVDL